MIDVSFSTNLGVSLFIHFNIRANNHPMMARRSSTRLSILVAGPAGSGKSSLINSIVGRKITGDRDPDDIDIYVLNLECGGMLQKTTFIEAPGFGRSMDDGELQDNIIEYIKEQFDSYIEEETKIRRNPKYEDTRVHCLLYLIPSTGYGLKQSDIGFLRKASGLVNIIPVLSKTDCLSKPELERLRMHVYDQMVYYQIKCFDFDTEDPSMQLSVVKNLNSHVPFSCVFPNNIEESGVRLTISGRIDTGSPPYCDFLMLRDALLSTHLDTLVEITSSELYENYRSEALENILYE